MVFRLLNLIVPLLEFIQVPSDDEKRNSLLGLTDKPSTKKQFFALLQDILLLPYGVTADASEVPAGMCSYAFKRVISNGWKAEELETMKISICRFLCSGVFSIRDALSLLVLASSDTRFSVATPAIAELSKVNASTDWSDPEITAPLYVLFLGNNIKSPERKTTPCSARVRQKLLQYLLKSRGKGINTVRGIQIVFEALFGANKNQKCKVLALQFCKNLIREYVFYSFCHNYYNISIDISLNIILMNRHISTSVRQLNLSIKCARSFFPVFQNLSAWSHPSILIFRIMV